MAAQAGQGGARRGLGQADPPTGPGDVALLQERAGRGPGSGRGCTGSRHLRASTSRHPTARRRRRACRLRRGLLAHVVTAGRLPDGPGRPCRLLQRAPPQVPAARSRRGCGADAVAGSGPAAQQVGRRWSRTARPPSPSPLVAGHACPPLPAIMSTRVQARSSAETPPHLGSVSWPPASRQAIPLALLMSRAAYRRAESPAPHCPRPSLARLPRAGGDGELEALGSAWRRRRGQRLVSRKPCSIR